MTALFGAVTDLDKRSVATIAFHSLGRRRAEDLVVVIFGTPTMIRKDARLSQLLARGSCPTLTQAGSNFLRVVLARDKDQRASPLASSAHRQVRGHVFVLLWVFKKH